MLLWLSDWAKEDNAVGDPEVRGLKAKLLLRVVGRAACAADEEQATTWFLFDEPINPLPGLQVSDEDDREGIGIYVAGGSRLESLCLRRRAKPSRVDRNRNDVAGQVQLTKFRLHDVRQDDMSASPVRPTPKAALEASQQGSVAAEGVNVPHLGLPKEQLSGRGCQQLRCLSAASAHITDWKMSIVGRRRMIQKLSERMAAFSARRPRPGRPMRCTLETVKDFAP